MKAAAEGLILLCALIIFALVAVSILEEEMVTTEVHYEV